MSPFDVYTWLRFDLDIITDFNWGYTSNVHLRHLPTVTSQTTLYPGRFYPLKTVRQMDVTSPRERQQPGESHDIHDTKRLD